MNLIASSMFLTGTASNPMCQKFAANLGIDITWMSWAAAGFSRIGSFLYSSFGII
jgi:DASS family divalent anion:Na+ symporter